MGRPLRRVLVRFYAELNDFLPPRRRGRVLVHTFHVSPAVKDVIESYGVPHPEVDLILVNGHSVGFDHRVRDGDLVSVYPVFESIDIRSVAVVRPEPLRQTRFVLDVHLGKLTTYLRLLGFDARYDALAGDAELVQVSVGERRILLTRDRVLLKRAEITHGYCLRHTDPRRQLKEVIERFDLAASVRPFTRCLKCNSPLVAVELDEVVERVPPGSRGSGRNFRRCIGCERVFWEGSHAPAMHALVDEVRGFNSRRAL